MAATIPADLHFMRVDTVGSFLRPAPLKEMFIRYNQCQASGEELLEAQDEAICQVIASQEAHHLPVITDGEFRRRNFMESFADVAGFDLWKSRTSALAQPQSAGREDSEPSGGRGRDPIHATRRSVSERLRLRSNRPLAEYRFAQSLTTTPVKVTLIGPDRVSQRFAPEESRAIYTNSDEFLADVVAIERQMVSELAQAGCQYIQVDEPGYTAYVDPHSLAEMRARGEDPVATIERSIQADNAVIAAAPGVMFGIHLCRGNRQSYWHREGAYDAIAERLFNGLNHRRFLLEYDTERAGGFEPLRFVPKDKIVVLGLITTKTGRMETVDGLKRRIEEATHYIPLAQLALSPQCGFASEMEGNLLSEDDQWRKLDVMLETAAQVWG
ncbi:MAG: methionine synthase [Ktedonobacteraceae bacterium]|nr:methionine synthase [Ktedonobacteraceae bacterium]